MGDQRRLERPGPTSTRLEPGSTKIHLAVDGRGRPMRILLTPGQAGDNPQLLPLLDGISVGRDGPGRPRCRPEVVILDKT